MARWLAKLFLAFAMPVAAGAVVGCQSSADAEAERAAEEQRRLAASLFADSRAAVAKGKEMARAQSRIRVDVYRLTLPLGTVSRNEAFWMRVNEQAVDVATYDLLFKNGVRVGTAPVSEWSKFRTLIEDQPTRTQEARVVGTEARDVDIELRKEIETQNIFYLDERNEYEGRTYDRCVNYLTVSFQEAPRKEGHVRLALVPVVKTLRRRLEFRGNTEREIAFEHPERLYDLNLKTDLSPDEFLIVAPSAEATWPTSIGNSFFVHDGPAEQMEEVLLFKPSIVQAE